jgi:hypothetical protein
MGRDRVERRRRLPVCRILWVGCRGAIKNFLARSPGGSGNIDNIRSEGRLPKVHVLHLGSRTVERGVLRSTRYVSWAYYQYTVSPPLVYGG